MQATSQTAEYEVILASLRDAILTVDMRVPGGSGTSEFAQFPSGSELRNFFAEAGLSVEKVQEIATIAEGLRPGEAFHAQMFLPTAVEERIRAHGRQQAA